jgi:glutamine synthetase
MAEVPKYKLSEIEKHTYLLIRKYEEKLFEEYNFRIAYGIESEFFTQNPLNKKENNIKYPDFDKSPKSSKTKDNSFIKSQIVESLEEEDEINQFEIILGKADKLKIHYKTGAENLKDISPSVIAHATLSTKNIIEKRTPELTGYRAKFKAYRKKDEVTSGIHSNMSFWLNEFNLLDYTNKSSAQNDLTMHIITSIIEHQNNLLPLYINDDKSFLRFNGDDSPSEIIFSNGKFDGNSSLSFRKNSAPASARLEDRLGAGDANPLFIALANIMAIYNAFERNVSTIQTDSFPNKLIIERSDGKKIETSFFIKPFKADVFRYYNTPNYELPISNSEKIKVLQNFETNPDVLGYLDKKVYNYICERNKDIISEIKNKQTTKFL